eukprot:gene21271-24139_t
MTEAVEYSVLYQGSKLFWRTRNTIDITIIQHCKFDITEIIAYEPSINVEAKRIYLNSCILIGKLNGGEIDSKLSFAKQNNIALSTQLSDRIIKQAIAEFVLSRLIISQFKREEGCFEVSFLFQSRDGIPASGGDELDELVCAKVAALRPYETKNYKLLVPGEVDAAFNALKVEQHLLIASCSEAAVLEAEAHAPLSGKERLPNLIMNEGKALNAGGVSAEPIIDAKEALQSGQAIEGLTKTHIHQHITRTTGVCTSGSADVAAAKPHDAPARGKCELSSRRASSPKSHTLIESSGRTPAVTRSSSRLFAGTATSQARAQCAAEDNHPTPKVSRKKMLKRASSRSVHSNNASKRSLRTGTRSESRDNTDSAVDPSSEADYSTLDNPANDDNMRSGFANQVVAGLSSLAASFSSKIKTPATNYRVSDDLNGDTQPHPEHCLAQGTVPTAVASRLNSPTKELAVGVDEISSHDADAAPVMGMKKQPSKGKRSSYFGSFLEALLRADSEPESQIITAEPLPNPSFNVKPSRKASWLPWNLFGAATVVPIK